MDGLRKDMGSRRRWRRGAAVERVNGMATMETSARRKYRARSRCKRAARLCCVLRRIAASCLRIVCCDSCHNAHLHATCCL